MTAEQLRNSILQEAISGRLVPQDSNDEPASVLLQRIREEKERLVKEKKLKAKDIVVTPITVDDIPYEIPNSWEWVRVKELFNVCSARRVHEKDWRSSGIPFYRAREIGKLAEFGHVDNDLYIDQELYNEFSKSGVPQENDLMVTAVGTLGRVYVVKANEIFYYKDGSVLCMENRFGINAKFAKLVIESPVFVSQYIGESQGTTVATLTMVRMNEYLLPLPPLAEQKRIVAKLEELLPIVEQYGKAQKELDELNAALPARFRQSILQQAISGKLVPQDENETADGLVKLITDRKNALLKSGELEKRYAKELPIDNSEFEIELPKGWCLCKLGNIARISAGGTPARGVAAYWSNGKIPWLKIADITASGKYVNSASEYITEAGMNNSSAKLMKKGTLLYTIFASIGEVGILNFEATCNQAIANIDLYIPEMTNYIYYYLKNLQAYMYSISKGCAQLNINQDILKNAIVPLPPLAEQKRIVAKIEELFAEIDKLK